MRPIEDHLKDYARIMLNDLGRKDGVRYLRGCLTLWRKEYGEVIAERVREEMNRMVMEMKK